MDLYTVDDQRKYALKLAGELQDASSDYDILSDEENGIKDLDLINVLYRMFHYGGQELDVTVSEIFAWLKSYDPELLTVIPPFETGTISLTQDSTSGTLSSAPAVGLGSFKNYFLKIETRNTIYRISAHTAASTSVTLDQIYLEDTGATLTYKIIKLDYELTNRIARVFKELRTDKYQFDEDPAGVIKYMTEDTFDQLYPRRSLSSGTPTVFTIVKEEEDIFTLRFNRYPNIDKMRVEVPYIPRPEELRVFEFATTDVTIGTDKITKTAHRLQKNQIVRFTSTGTLPAGLLVNTNYYIIVSDANDFQVSITRDGSAVDLTDVGSGTHRLSSVPKLPHGYRTILSDYAVYGIMIDKSDPRAAEYKRKAQAQLQAMVQENRRTARKASKNRGRLIPRRDDGYFRNRFLRIRGQS